MTRLSNLVTRQLRITIITSCGMVSGVALACWWTLTITTPPIRDIALATVEIAAPSVTVINPSVWAVQLYQPLRDTPTVAEPASSTLKLVSIITKNGDFIAAIATVEGLTFVKKGDALPWGTINHIEAQAVDITTADRTMRLKLQP